MTSGLVGVVKARVHGFEKGAELLSREPDDLRGSGTHDAAKLRRDRHPEDLKSSPGTLHLR